MRLPKTITTQFERPHGLLGHMTGWIMAHRTSNKDRNRWTVDLLDIQPNDHVLELGCGPGLALQSCLTHATDGLVVGLDHSETMLAQSCARNRQAIRDKRLELRFGSLGELSDSPAQYNKIYSVNVIQFLEDLHAVFSVFYHHLKPGGLVATTYMPRGQNPSRAKAWQMANEVTRHMVRTGFTQIRTEELTLKPIPAICVLGTRS